MNEYSQYNNSQNIYGINKAPNQGLVTGAMVLGILTIVGTCMVTVYLPYIFGGISIILAVLSRGTSRQLDKQARLGVILSIMGMVFNTIIIIGSIYVVFTNAEAYSQFDEMFKSIYGMNFSDMWNQIQYGGEFL